MGAVKRFGARLGTEHIGGTWMLIACAEFVLAFATASTLFQFGSANDGWSWGASVAGGIVCPALGVLLIAGDPGRYRTFGYPVRAWLVDHTVLGVLVLLLLFSGPVFELASGETHGAPAGIVVVPVLTVAAVVAAVLVHHRHLLAGRTRRENTRQAWYDRVFLARSGPLLWRVVYQPVGLVALVAAVAVILWGDVDDVYVLPGLALVVSLVCSAVVAASQRAATAVGMPRRVWLVHAVTATAAPVALVSVAGVLGFLGDRVQVKEMESGSMVTATGTVLVFTVVTAVLVGLLAGATAVVFSYEGIATCIIWYVLLSLGLELLLQVRWQGLSQAGGAVLELVIVGLTTLMSLSYARHRVMTGQPDWFGTRIIRSAQRKALA
jgi:hypothetical protein